MSETVATEDAPAVEEDAPTRVPTAPCFCCGSREGTPVHYAYYGWLWPKLLHEVQCVDCPVTYNARTGQSNGPKVLALHVVHLLLGVAAAVLLAVYVKR